MVNLVKKEVNVCKEISEVGELLVGIVKAIKAKKTVAEITSVELAHLMSAIDGINLVADEMKDPAIYQTATYMTGEILTALMKNETPA